MIPVNSVLQVGFFPEIMQDEVLRRLKPVMMPDPQGPIPQKDVQAILTRPSYPIAPTLLDQLPQIKMIACCGVGYDNLPLDYLKQRGIMASNTPGGSMMQCASSRLVCCLPYCVKFPRRMSLSFINIGVRGRFRLQLPWQAKQLELWVWEELVKSWQRASRLLR